MEIINILLIKLEWIADENEMFVIKTIENDYKAQIYAP